MNSDTLPFELLDLGEHERLRHGGKLIEYVENTHPTDSTIEVLEFESKRRSTGPVPSLSVVIPTRNRRSFLQETVASVRAQTRKDWEMIVVDDASDDGTSGWLATVADSRIRSFRMESHAERAAARNRGLAEAHGPLVMFLDDDDLLRPHALERLATALERDPEAVAAVGARWRFLPDGTGARMNHPAGDHKRVVWRELLAGWSAVSGQMLYRTALVRNVGGYRPTFNPADDRELWLRLAVLGPVLLVPDIVLEYRVHDGQVRPPDIEQIRERLFAEFVERLPPACRARGRRIMGAGRSWRRAELAVEQQRYRDALGGFAKAAVAAPSLLGSPLVWPAFARGFAKAVRGIGRR
jgi:glycosyltransferase involved in cell wall biosynthesis